VKAIAILLGAVFLTTGAAGEEDPPLFAVQGNVTNAVTSEVLRRATVHLQGVQSMMTTADAGGHFSFTGLTVGTYVITAEKPGFSATRPQAVNLGPSREDVKLELAPLGHITGRVADENDDPVLNASVQIFRSVILNGRRQTVSVSNVASNDRGEFRASSLPSGRYFVGANGQPEPDGTAYPRMFYGGTNDISAAAPIELRAGGDTKISITLRPSRGFRIRGKIVNLPPGQHAFPTIARKGAPLAASEGRIVQTEPETGTFEFRGIPPGAYTVIAGALGQGSQLTGTVDVVVSDRDVDGLSVSVAKAPELTGVVRGDPPGADIRGVSIAARPTGDGSQPSLGAQIGSDGTFILPGIQTGDYYLAVRVSEPRYVKSVLLGGREIGAGSFSVSVDGAQGSFEVIIGTGGGLLEGTVTEGNAPAANVTVLLLGIGQERAGQTDVTGTFRFAALAPGDYTAYAVPDLQDLEYLNPEVIRRYSGSHVSIAAGTNERIELKLNRTVY
jgi:hypothetical protein